MKNNCAEVLTSDLNDSMIRITRKVEDTAYGQGIEMLKHLIYQGI